MSRRQAREVALQALFGLDLNQESAPEKLEAHETLAIDTALQENRRMAARDREYARGLVHGTRMHKDKIDNKISHASKRWRLERMNAVDRNIARIAVYEMLYAEEKVGVKIAINEAVELAKKFGAEDSSRYVNGILGAIAMHNDDAAQETSEQTESKREL